MRDRSCKKRREMSGEVGKVRETTIPQFLLIEG